MKLGVLWRLHVLKSTNILNGIESKLHKHLYTQNMFFQLHFVELIEFIRDREPSIQPSNRTKINCFVYYFSRYIFFESMVPFVLGIFTNNLG
jgi:hypothetical protein